MLALPSKSQIFLNPCLISSSSKVSGQCENPRHVPYALKKQLSKFSTKAWQRKLNSHEGENERQPEGVIASKKFVFYLKITCVSCILLHNSFLFVLISVQFSSVTQLCLTLWPQEPLHARPPCPSPTPGVHPNPCPLSRWCHTTISSSVVPFFSCLQSFPASGSFPMSQLFASGGQSIRVSASTPFLPKNTQDWSSLGWAGWISLQPKKLSRVFSNTTVQMHQFLGTQLSL